jgi:adenylate cyclase
LEALAVPGGVCISGMVFDALGSKLPLNFESLGEKNVKNISEPVRAYNVELKPGTKLPKTGELENKKPKKRRFIAIATVIVLATGVGVQLWVQFRAPELEVASVEKITNLELDKPSIAVLPFANISGDADQEYFSDGISEDIITDLSQLSNLGVIARNSSFAYKGTSVNIQDVANELGVRYVLEGSVQKSGDRIRVTAQLIDAISGHHLWAERYDRRVADFFELQDEIRIKIVSALSIKLAGNEGKQLLRKKTNSFEAYDLFLKGRRFYGEFTDGGVEQAKTLYIQAIELDPEFARAYGALGIALVRQVALMTVDSIDESLDQALVMAQKAVSIEATSPQTQWALGFVHMWRGEYEQAAKAVQESVTLFPNYADGWGLLALINNQLGRGDQALRFIRKGMELNPGYSFDYPYNEGRAYYNLGEYEKAVEPLLNALERNENAVNPRLYLAASYVRLGRVEDAEWEITQVESVNPEISIVHLEQFTPMVDGEHRIRFLDDMRRAGLSE